MNIRDIQSHVYVENSTQTDIPLLTSSQCVNIEKSGEVAEGHDVGHDVGFLLHSEERPKGARRNIATPGSLTTPPDSSIEPAVDIPHISNKLPSNRRTRILIIGYYFHNNTGDDQYIDVFKYILKSNLSSFRIKFIDCDKLQDTTVKKNDIIIIGGGDVLNHYFLDKINAVFKEKSNKIIAVSVGIPYLDILVNTRKLDIIDYIFVRTKQEHSVLREFYCYDRIFYLPDLSYFMKNVNFLFDTSIQETWSSTTLPVYNRFPSVDCRNIEETLRGCLRPLLRTFHSDVSLNPPCYFETIRKKIIGFNIKLKVFGFMLNRHIYSKQTHDRYITLVKEIAKVVKWLLTHNYNVVFLPFNTFTGNDSIDDRDNYENDVLLHNDVYEETVRITPNMDKYEKNIVNIQQYLTANETFELFKYIDYAIPMRFHATLYSIYNHVPFISVYTTKKIRNLLTDINYNEMLGYGLEVDSNDLPLFLDGDVLLKKIRYLTDSKKMVKETRQRLKTVCQEMEKELNRSIYNLLYLIEHSKDIRPHKKKILTEKTGEFLSYSYERPEGARRNIKIPVRHEMHIYNDVILSILAKLKEYCGNDQDFRTVTDRHKQDIIVSIVSFYLTGGDLHSSFNHGMSEKMFLSNSGGVKYNYVTEWRWVIKENLLKGGRTPVRYLKNTDEVENYPPFTIRPTPDPRFNIHYFNQEDNSGVHRSGWNHVYNELRKYHTDLTTAPLLDLYMDRTFHWERETLKAIGIIPYCKKWRGFIHHTFDTSFSNFNNINLLRIPEFVDSLPFCEMLYVLSNTLQKILRRELNKMGWEKIPVICLTHPTNMDGIPTFQYKSFLENTDKRILYIGGWLRNTLSFYHLSVPPILQLASYKRKERMLECLGMRPVTTDFIKKTVIVNKNGANYHPISGIERSVFESLRVIETSIYNKHAGNSCGGGKMNYRNIKETIGMVKDHATGERTEEAHKNTTGDASTVLHNNWNKQFYEFFDKMVNSVERLNKLSDDEYDAFLTNNIVFLHLVDGSAINTLIECCVRNTPIIINKHPAVVEILGDKYPLFYETEDSTVSPRAFFDISQQVTKLLSNPIVIYNTHRYMVSLDKRRFHINHFKHELFQTF